MKPTDIKIINILSFNEDPSVVWMSLEDLQDITELSEIDLNDSLSRLITEDLVQVTVDDKGMKVALIEKISNQKVVVISEGMEEAKNELAKAIENEDFEYAAEIRDIMDRYGVQ